MRLQSPSPSSGTTTCGGCDSPATVRPNKPDPATGPHGWGHWRHRSTPTAHRSASQTRTRGFRGWGRRPPSPAQATLSADDAQGPPGHTGQGPGGLRCGSEWGSGGRHSPGPRTAGGRGAHTDPAGLLSAARLPHGRHSLGSVRLRGSAPSDPHARKRENTSTPRVGHAEPGGSGLAEFGQPSRRETRVLGRQDPALALLA